LAQFLTTQGTSYYLEQIIIKATKRLILVSPYLKISDIFMDRLQDAAKHNVEIIVIYGKDELKPGEMQKLSNLKNLSLHYHKNLHAKCFLNEDLMVITSMNIHEFSEKTNREMGVLVKKDEDNNIYNEAFSEVQSILDSAEKIRETKSKPEKQLINQKSKSTSGFAAAGKAVLGLAGALADSLTDTPKKGHCIRCAQAIELNPKRPYCEKCYSKWAEYKKKTFTEKFCHQCGKANKSSMSRPLCRDCY